MDKKLSALLIAADIDLRRVTIEQIVTKYGIPDRVTWGNTYETRAVIWPELGILILMDAYSEYTGGSILFYSPIPLEALETSWILASLPDGPIGSPPEDVVLGSEYDMEDPWGIER